MKAKLNIYIDRRRECEFYPVYFTLSKSGKKVLIGTGLTCKTDIVGREYQKDEPNRTAKNRSLNAIYNNVEYIVLESPENVSLKMVKERIEAEVMGKTQVIEKNLLYYFDEFVSTKTNEGTKSIYNLTRNKIEEYAPGTTLDDVNKVWLAKFESHLSGQGLSTNYISLMMRNIRAVFNYCIDEEYTTSYPFRKYTIKTEQTSHRCLTVEQIRKLRDYPVEEWQEIYRDMFMLMFYLIGINAGDLFLATENDVHNGRIIFNRQKTGSHHDMLIPAEAMEIIDKYRGKDYLLCPCDKYSDYKEFIRHMNRGLKKIGKKEKVPGRGWKYNIHSEFPNLSTYWARHTWATLASECDIDKDTIGKALGHSWATNSVTDIYIKADQSKIDKAQLKVIKYLNKE